MGQKVHPGGLRVGVIHDWKSNWMVGKKEFAGALLEDIKIREHILKKLSHAGLSDILIRKDKQRITIDIYTARPGIVIGKSGVEVDALRKEVHALTQKNVHININEIKRPELDAKLVAQSIAEQLQNRVSFRRAMKRSLASAIRSGAAGVKVQCSGRLGGSEMSRSEQYSEGRVPLHTIRADIDYGFVEARTPTGRIGVKVWINKGEIMPEGYGGPSAARRRASATRTRLAAAVAHAKASAPRARPAATVRQDREGLGPVRRGRPGQRGGAGGAGGPGGARPAGARGRSGSGSGRPAPDRSRGETNPPANTPPDARRAGRRLRRSRKVEDTTTPVVDTPAADDARSSRRPQHPRQRRGNELGDAAPQENQVPQGAPRPSPRRGEGPDDGPVRRLRDQGARDRLGHQPADRGGPDRDDAQDQARRQGLDQRLPRQAVHQEAGRDPHG